MGIFSNFKARFRKPSAPAATVNFNVLPNYLTIDQVSEILQVHPNTLRNWDNTGRLRAIRIGPRRDRRYEQAAIKAEYEKMRPSMTPPAPPPKEKSYVLKPGFSWRWITLYALSKRFTLFMTSVAIVAFSFAAAQAAFFVHVFIVNAEEARIQRVELAPTEAEGWLEPSRSLAIDALPTATLADFAESEAARYDGMVPAATEPTVLGETTEVGATTADVEADTEIDIAADTASAEIAPAEEAAAAPADDSAVSEAPSETATVNTAVVDPATEEPAEPSTDETEPPVPDAVNAETEPEDADQGSEPGPTAVALDAIQPSLVVSGFPVPDSIETGATVYYAELVISLAAQGDPISDDVLLLEYSSDAGETWQPLESFSLTEDVSNATHGGYFTYALTDVLEPQQFADVWFRAEIDDGGTPEQIVAWLDGVQLNAEIHAPDPVVEAIQESVTFTTGEGADLAATEQPVIAVETEKESVFGFLGVDPTEREVTEIVVTEPMGEQHEAVVAVVETKEGRATTSAIAVDTTTFQQPGKYTVAVTVIQEGKEETITYSFTWGEIAVNPDQATYRAGETALLSVGLVDDAGDVVCEADIELTITSPRGQVTTLSTDNGGVVQSQSCYLKQEYLEPDYYAEYPTTTAGRYDITLTARYRGETRTTTTSFSAEADPRFIVSRDGPTRVFPKVAQPMRLTATAREDFTGEIRELVPGVFESVEARSGGRVEPYDTGSEIAWSVVWDVALIAGESVNLEYYFKSPNEAPATYFLGPAMVGDDWTESRSWQLVIDATYLYLLGASSSAPTDWSYISTFNGEYLRAASTYGGTDGSATHTHTFTESVGSASATVETSSSGGTARAADDHTHASTGTSITAANNDPAHYTYYLWRYDTADSTPTTVPQNSFAFFKDGGTPASPWSRFSSADDRLVQFNSSHEAAGSDTHTHPVTWGSLNASSGTEIPGLIPTNSTDYFALDGHTHTAPATPTETGSATSIPLYSTLQLYQQAGSPPSVPTGMIALFDAAPPDGWTAISNAAPYQNTYVRSAASSGATGGSASNTHADVSGTTASPPAEEIWGSRFAPPAGADFASPGHTHDITLSGFNSPSHDPVYRNFILAECTSCADEPLEGVTLSGSLYSDEGSTPVTGSSKTIVIWVDGNANACGGAPCSTSTNPSNGAWSMSSVDFDLGSVITVFVDGDAIDANIVYKSDGTTQSDLHLFQNRVIVRNDTGTSITNTNLESGDNDGSEDDILFAVSSGNVTVTDNIELHVYTGDTYDPNGSVTTGGTGDLHVDDSATMYLDTATNTIAAEITVDTGATLNVSQTTNVNGSLAAVSVSGTLNHSGGTFTIGNSTDEDLSVSGTVNLSGGTTAIADDFIIGSGTTTITNTVTIAGFLDQNGGTLNVNTGSDINVTGLVDFNGGGTGALNLNGGSLDNSGHWYLNGGTVTLAGGSHHTGTTSYLYFSTAANVTFNMTGGDLYAGSLLLSNDFTLTTTTVSGGTLHLGQGTTGGKTYYDLQANPHRFYNLQVDYDAYFFDSSTQPMTLDGTFTIANGVTFTLNAQAIVINDGGNWTNNGTLAAGTGNVTLLGGDINGSSDTTFNDLTIGDGSSGTVTINGTDDPTVSGTFTVSLDDALLIGIDRTVTYTGAADMALSGSISGTGTGKIIFPNGSGGPGTGGSLNAGVQFLAATGDVAATTVDARTYGTSATVEFYSTSGSAQNIYLNSGTYTFNGDVSVSTGGAALALDLNTNDPSVTINNDLTIGGSTSLLASNSGTFDVNGDFTNSGTFTHGSGTVLLSGAAQQTVSGTLTGASAFNNLTVTNASGTASPWAPSVIFSSAVTVAGTFTADTPNSKLQFQSGQTFAATFIDMSPASGYVYLRSNTTVAWLFNVTNAPTVTRVDVSYSNASGGAAINATDSSNVNSGNNTNWTFTLTVSGTADGSAGSTVKVAFGSSVQGQTGTIVAGTPNTWSISGLTLPAAGAVITVWIDEVGDASEATGVTAYLGYGNVIEMVLDANVLAIGSGGSASVTVTNLGSYDTENDEDVVHGVNVGNTILNATAGGSYIDPTIRILSSDTLTIGGTETLQAHNVQIDGSLTSSGNATYTASGSWDNNGDYNYSTETITFTSGSAETIDSTGATDYDVGTVVFSGSGSWEVDATWQANGNVTVSSGTLTLNAALGVGADVTVNGILNGTANLTVNGGDITGTGTVSLTSGTTSIRGTGWLGGDENWTFGNLTLDFVTCANVTTTAQGTGSITISGTLTTSMCAGGGPEEEGYHTLNAGNNKTWILSGSGTPFVNGGALIAATSTFSYRGSSATTIARTTYYDLEVIPGPDTTISFASNTTSVLHDLTIDAGGANTVVTAATNNTTLNVDNDVIITDGTLVAHASNSFTVGGNWFNAATFNANGGTVTFDAGDTGNSIIAGFSSFNDAVFDNGSGEWSFDGSPNPSVGGDITVTTGTLTISGLLTVTGDVAVAENGTLTGSNDLTINGGDLTGNGTVTMSGGTVYFGNASGNLGGSGATAWTFYNLTFDYTGTCDAGSVNYTTTATGTNSITINGTLETNNCIYNVDNTVEHSFNAGAKTYTMTGAGDVFSAAASTFTPSSSTFIYTNTTSVTINESYYNLELSPAAPISGTYSITPRIGHDLTISPNVTLHATTATVTMDGGGTLDAGGVTFYDLNVGTSAAGTVTVANTGFTVARRLTFANNTSALDIPAGVTVTHSGTVASDSIMLYAGSTISGDGTLAILDTSVGPGNTGTLSVDVRFDASAGNIANTTFDARTYGGDVELYASSGTNSITGPTSGTFAFSGNLTTTCAGCTSLTVDLDDSTDATYTVTGNLSIDASTTLQAPSSTTLSVGGNFDNGGTFTHNSGTVALTGGDGTTQAITGSTTFTDLSASTASNAAGRTIQFAGSSTTTVLGTWTVTGFTGKVITLQSSDTNNWTINPTAASVTYANVTRSTNSGTEFCATYSTDNSYNSGWYFSATDTCGITISGTAYSNESGDLITNSEGVFKYVNSTTGKTASSSGGTNGSGEWSISTFETPSNGDVLTIWINETGPAAPDATLVLKYNGTSTSLSLYQDRVILRNDYSGSITNSDLEDCDNDSGANCATDTEIGFTSNSNALIVSSGRELHIWTGDSYDPGGTVTTNATGGDFHVGESAITYLDTATSAIGRDIIVDNGATLTIQASTTVGGGDITTAGTGTVNYSGSPTVTISGTGSIGGGSTTVSLYSLTTSGTGTTTIASALTAGGYLTIGANTTLVGPSGTLTVGRNWVNNGTYTHSSGLVSLTGNGYAISGSNDTTFYNLRIGDAGGTMTINNGDDPIVTNTLDIDTGNTLVIGSGRTVTHTGNTLTLDGTMSGPGRYVYRSATAFPTSGTLNSSLILRMDATATNQTLSARADYQLVEIDNSGVTAGRTVTTAAGTITLASSLTLLNTGAGSTTIFQLDTNDPTFTVDGAISIAVDTTLVGPSGGALNVGGDWSNSGTFTHSSGTVTLNGSAQQTVSGTLTGASAFNDLTVTNASAANPDVIFSSNGETDGTFTAATAGTQLQFNAGSTYTFANLSLNGQAEGTRVTLRSSSTGTQWNLVSLGTQTVSNTDVRDSAACGGDTIDASDGTNFDAGNNTCWTINTLSFAISDTSIGFGSLSAVAARWATGDTTGSATAAAAHTLAVTTNARNGYTVTYTGTDLASGANTIDAGSFIGQNGTPGSEQFALSVATNGDATISAGYQYGDGNSPSYAFSTGGPVTIANEIGSTATETFSIYYLANIAGITEAGAYATDLTFILTPTF